MKAIDRKIELEAKSVTRAVNDATLNKAGDIYQYLVALKDCFELNDGDILQIEQKGDISVITQNGGLFQKEVKHHFGKKKLADRDIDFWKTLANWYVDYERIKNFSHFILSTTAEISQRSSFYEWNDKKKEERLNCLKKIGNEHKAKENEFRIQYNRIFNDSYDEEHLLDILSKFTIEEERTAIAGISNEFLKYIRFIPEENKDGYIAALLGRIVHKIVKPPHKWEVTKEEFDEFCQIEAVAYGNKGEIPLPREYAKANISEQQTEKLEQQCFVKKIREIKYDSEIAEAISDYWKTDLTVGKYFHDNLMYLESLESYKEELYKKMTRQKHISDRSTKGKSVEEKIDTSQDLYDNVMMWEANDFGSIVRNEGFFQRGVIHNIVDETKFRWKVGEETK